MIARLIEYCATHRGIVFTATLFAVAGAVMAIRQVPLDAIPDLSDPQVIVFTEWMGRSPDLVEDQITYPIVSSLLAAPRVQTVRGQSMFGMSFIYVIFEEGTDLYWARSRVLEYMSSIRERLPDGVNPVLGPDATAVGWGFQYALIDTTGTHDLAELRAFQDFTLRYALASVKGVAEVASVGGYERQYQVEVDPARLHAYGLALADVRGAIRRSNSDVGGRVIEMSGREYFVRGRGYINSLDDIRQIALGADRRTGTPIRIADVGNVSFGPDIRRGLAEFNGIGEAVGGTIVVRFGENVLNVIERVKTRIAELEPSFPPGMQIEVVYDRSDLIHRAIETLRHTLLEEGIVVSVMILIFLLHFRSTLVPVLSLPVAKPRSPRAWCPASPAHVSSPKGAMPVAASTSPARTRTASASGGANCSSTRASTTLRRVSAVPRRPALG
jgi:Cu(I)/Ag(I) efflux system membrane protein CusA/SilA